MYYNENTVIYFNGGQVKASQAKTDLYSQSLHYGYAVFEGIKSYKTPEGASIFKAREHYERLQRSAAAMRIPFGYSVDELISLTEQVLASNNLTDAYVRPLVFCSPNMGLSQAKESYLAIEAWEWTKGYMSDRMRVMTSSFRRPNPQAFLVEAKVSGHYVNSILVSQEAKDRGYDEAVVLDAEGFIAESSGANIFFERHGVLYTPQRGHILPGITRATVMELCQHLEIPLVEGRFTADQMRGADAAFFCGTAAEIVGLVSLDDVAFSKKWEDTQSARIQHAYRDLVTGNLKLKPAGKTLFNNHKSL